MRKIFEDVNGDDFIEFIKGADEIHMFINYPNNKEHNGEFVFTEKQILQIIGELSNLLQS